MRDHAFEDLRSRMRVRVQVAQRHLEFVCPITIIAGTDKAPALKTQAQRLMRDPVTGALAAARLS